MQELQYAISAIVSPPVVVVAFVGVFWGILSGAIPGISTSIAMALVIPFTYEMAPLTAMVLLCGVYAGSEYGGSIPAILIGTPPGAGAAVTVLDGHPMHLQGRGGEALGLSLVGGTIGGLFGLVLLTTMTEPLARVALLFHAPGYFALGVLGISVIASVSSGAVIKGLISGILGIVISTVGIDTVSGLNRFSFDRPELIDGISVIVVMMGMFAVSEMLMQAATGHRPAKIEGGSMRIKLPSLRKLWDLRVPQFIALVLGTIEGLTPGGGGSIAAFMSYNEAKRWSKAPERFGKGSEEGVIAPEAANNVVASTALIPTLSFGIPGSNAAAILLAALIIHGLQPGPQLFINRPEIVYGLFGGLFLVNFAMLVVGVLLLTPAIWLVNRPQHYLAAAIFGVIFSGMYSALGSIFDLALMLFFGVCGYLLRLCGFPILPLVLGLVLGSMIERNYRRSVELSYGDHWIFVTDPIAASLLGLALLLIVYSLYTEIRRPRAVNFPGGD
jgi:putative tricarboxylic transport membrane protein